MSALDTTKVPAGSNMVSDNVNVPLAQIEAWANGNVDSTNIPDGGITGVKLADSTVTSEKLLATVAFSAVESESRPTATLIDITNYDTTDFNHGSGFDATTGVFTAPYDGIYQINAMNQAIDMPAATRVYVEILINGTSQFSSSTSSGAANHDPGVTLARVFELTAGDTVIVRGFHDAGTNKTFRTYFSGHIVGRI